MCSDRPRFSGDANRFRGGNPAYKVQVVSAGNERAISSRVDTPLLTDLTYSQVRGEADTLLAAGGVGAREMQYEPHFWIG